MGRATFSVYRSRGESRDRLFGGLGSRPDTGVVRRALDKTPSVIILRGKQGVQKFNKTSVDDVRIFVALYRVEEKEVDLVLTLNFPMSVGDGDGNTRTEEQAQSDFHAIATSLRIIDFNLFA